jgi:hypothetical protein
VKIALPSRDSINKWLDENLGFLEVQNEATPHVSIAMASWPDDGRLNRIWLHANLAVWLVGFILILSCTSVAFVLLAAEGSAILTLFFVTIPSRVAMNVIVRDRRRRYFKETVVCFATFGILCWLAYLITRYPNSYP